MGGGEVRNGGSKKAFWSIWNGWVEGIVRGESGAGVVGLLESSDAILPADQCVQDVTAQQAAQDWAVNQLPRFKSRKSLILI